MKLKCPKCNVIDHEPGAKYCHKCGSPLIGNDKTPHTGMERPKPKEVRGKTLTKIYSGHEYVDLGLPSGTLWATCNMGTNIPEIFGDYYAWGEKRPKSRYSWDNYEFYGGENGMTKYCNIAPHVGLAIDNLKELQPIDDVATSRWGTDWRIPTHEHWHELLNYTKNEWQLKNDVYGRLFISNNGNSLFLPAAGLHSDRFEDSLCGNGFYWCSSLYADKLSLHNPDDALCCVFDANRIYISEWHRPHGLSIRPVLIQ